MSFLQRSNKDKPEWITDANGEPVAPALLTVAEDRGLEADIIVNMLAAYGIPSVTTLPGESMIGKVYVGVPTYGVPIYVPETMLDDAKSLLEDDGAEDVE